MKKITLLFFLMMVSVGYAQIPEVIEDFEGATPTFTFFDGANAANIVADPATGGTNGNVLQLITNTAGNPWQGTQLLFQGDNADLTVNPVVTIDVYSDAAQSILAKMDGPESGGNVSATDANYTTPGQWQTLTFNFSAPVDGLLAANDVYANIIFYPGWENLGGTCSSGCYSTGGPGSTPAITIYLDNINAVAAVPAETCNDGMLNNGEEEIDCGGPNCDACPTLPSTQAPWPGTPDSEVASIYSDTGGSVGRNFANEIAFDYSFGAPAGPDIDFDAGPGENFAIQMNFAAQGYGQGVNGGTSVDLSAYNYINFDYWADVNSTEIRFILINEGQPEFNYEISDTGTTGDADIVNEAWTHVSVPLTDYVGFNKAAFFQYKLGTSSDLVSDYVYFDNIYFSVNPGIVLSNDDFSAGEFKVFPNPANNEWNIRTNGQNITSVQVFDILGKNVMTVTPNSDAVKLDATALPAGLYFAKMTSDSGTKSVKLVKQ